jgi:hypothetical protein
MAKLVGNLNEDVDLDVLISKYFSNGNGFCDNDPIELSEECSTRGEQHLKMLMDAGYPNPPCIGTMYYPHWHYPLDVVLALDRMFGTICTFSFVSECMPGHVVPHHPDWDGREERLLELGTIEAYHVHISKPEPGHVFMIEGHAYHMEEQGNIYRWDDYTSWHSGANSGFNKKYFMVYRGLRPHTPFEYEYVFEEQHDSVKFKITSTGEIV